MEPLLDLVAVATVADIMPLIGENRRLVVAGLRMMNAFPRPGVRALIETSGLKPGEVDAAEAVQQLDARAVLAALPPLIKGYLRLGGLVGDGAVIDSQFNTTDVCIIVVTDRVTDKYFNHYRLKAGGDDNP
jgi:single-stranded DNA-specific DHH superfamily exonuclease